MTEEHRIQNEIRLALADTCVMFRINVGKGYTPDGRYFDTGVPKGFSDLFGVRKVDGRAVFIEVKTTQGRPTDQQNNFLETMRKNGAIAGVCRSPEEAVQLVTGGQ
ncbi:VRR-NUC domain-containing protein [Ruminococcus flavefaciens]|uniref:VRR-NUC domain-containing protein n=1 Tax=Ruminococcus flavefaciens TaxID=1265 RepID=UPI000490AE93|nr:VRR-NUC domain-containing protein [Ruminococcus flavefaciens]